MKSFKVTAFVLSFHSQSDVWTAVGNSKKAAKKAAAEKMVAKLRSLSGSAEITWVS